MQQIVFVRLSEKKLLSAGAKHLNGGKHVSDLLVLFLCFFDLYFSISLIRTVVWEGGDSKMKLSAVAADWNGGKTCPNRFIDLEKSHLFVFSKLTQPFLQYIPLAVDAMKKQVEFCNDTLQPIHIHVDLIF